MLTPKMYVLVRNDLSNSYKFVQGVHAVAHFSLKFPETFAQWNNNTIAILGVRNLKELKEYLLILNESNEYYASFSEEDLDNQLTSIACYSTGELFKNLKVA